MALHRGVTSTVPLVASVQHESFEPQLSTLERRKTWNVGGNQRHQTDFQTPCVSTQASPQKAVVEHWKSIGKLLCKANTNTPIQCVSTSTRSTRRSSSSISSNQTVKMRRFLPSNCATITTFTTLQNIREIDRSPRVIFTEKNRQLHRMSTTVCVNKSNPVLPLTITSIY